ncbi:LysE family translocator [Melghirimyces algeriensis]|uniref:Threonine/homoserine/homoserine lactone efflux protein n=1 Tax=Melghirimyces algeriensis TaxID=910412 RepID=A0A521FGE4_9BACL|nr:LysE family translocator [Melghirimyces algeriensis]SMO95268.1 Threonine/homoserine/homoserine lactone efflux protein [Melghirimyces algeriensis]
MEWTSLLSFIGFSVLLTLMPGPDLLFVMTQSLTHRPMHGFAVAAGLCTGLVVHTTAAALGISAILVHSSLAFSILKFAGALYLFYLAWQSLCESGSGSPESVSLTEERTSLFALYRRGIWMNLLNPKVSLFFLAFLPQFVSAEAGSVPAQMVLLGVLFMIQAFLVFVTVSLTAHWIGQKLFHRGFGGTWLSRGKAGIYALLGMRLLLMDQE